MYDQEEKKLANEIAHALNDREALTLYLTYTRKYREEFLRRILVRVLAVPEHKIKRSRGALFTFLIGQHGNDDIINFRR
jgi:hypothetical protein